MIGAGQILAESHNVEASELGNPKTDSEILFEEYLRAHCLFNWNHEAPVEGKRTTPDYRLEFGGSTLFFEVK